MSIQWILPVWGWPLLLLAGVIVGFLVRRLYRQTVPTAPDRLRRVLVTLRLVTLILLLLAVARPALLRLLPQRDSALVVVVVEDSASMSLVDVRDPATRTDIGRWWSAWQLAAAVDSLLAAHPEQPRAVFLRGNGLRPPDPVTPAVANVETPEAVGTDLLGLLAQSRQRFFGQPLRALIVVSDGNVTDRGAAAAADREIATPAQVWLAGVGDPVGPADRYLTDLRYPEIAYQGEDVTVELTVAQRFVAGAGDADSLRIELRQGDEVLARATGPPATDLQRFELVFSPREPGLHILEVEVAPLGNERYLMNNRATLAVDVHKDRARLLVLAAVPGWDVRFLSQAALSESRLDVSVVHPGPVGPVLADSMQSWQPPPDVDAWLAWDGVVLSGPPGPQLVGDGRDLAEAVRRGLGLLVLAGGTPASGQAGGAEIPRAIADLMPVAVESPVARPGEFFLAPAGADQRHPVLSGVTHGGQSGDHLDTLPPLRELQPATVRPGGVVLMTAVLARQPDGSRPVLVLGRAGSGRCLWFGGRRLWELAFWEWPDRDTGLKEHPGRRLLRNLLVWTAVGEDEAGISLVGRRLSYQEGERIRIEARWVDLRGEPVTGRPLTVRVESVGDGASATLRTYALTPSTEEPGLAAASLPPLPPGRYLLTPQGDGKTPVQGTARPLVVTPASVEQTQVRQDRRTLRQVAARAGGRALDLGEPGARERLLSALQRLDLSAELRQRQQRWELWASWPLLAILVVCLGCEWLLRRRHGML